MKRKWTRGEKLLWATPVLVGAFAAAVIWGPQLMRGAMGGPQVWATTSDTVIRSMALSANGDILAAGGARDSSKSGWLEGSGTIYLWDARTGEQLPPIAPIYGRDKDGPLGWDVYGLALSPDAAKIGFSRVGQDWTITDTATRTVLWRFPRFMHSAGFSDDGTFIALSDDKLVYVVSASDGKVRAQWKRSDSSHSRDVAWSPDGKWVANIGAYKENNPIEIHRAEDGKLVRSIPNISGHPKLTSVMFSPDGKSLLSSSVPGIDFPHEDYPNLAPLRCYEAATGKLQWEVKAATLGGANLLNASFCHAIFSPDGKIVAAYQYRTGQVFLLDSETGTIQSARQLRTAEKIYLSVPPGLIFAPDGKRLFVRGSSAVLVMDLD